MVSNPIEPYLPEQAALDIRLAEAAKAFIEAALRRGILMGADEAHLAVGMDVLNPKVIEFLNSYTGLMANRVNRTMVEKIRGALIEGLEDGLSFRDMRSLVLDALGVTRQANGKITADKGARYTAERITRTEVSRAQNAGRNMQLKEAGAVRKVWRTATGACEFCLALEGMTIGIDENFFAKGETLDIPGKEDGTLRSMHLDYSDTPHPPLHPNCVCVTAYEFDEQGA